MQSISQIQTLLSTFDNLSKNIFLIKSSLEPLQLLKSVPDDITSAFTDPELNKLADSLTKDTADLLIRLQPISDLIQSEVHKLHKTKHGSMDQTPYADFTIEEPPIITKIEPAKQLSFNDLLKQYLDETGKPLKPVNRRTEFSYEGVCPHCGAPNEYIYDNNNNGQFLCKVCHNVFTYQIRKPKEIEIRCPHCNHQLMFHHDRQNYLVYVCQNEKCPYYLKNKRTLAEDKSKLNPVSSGSYKLKYSYREFKFTLDDVKRQGYSFETKVDLDKIQSSQHILGLILTYHINYGMSTRKTAQIMKDIHNVVISHQTVANYCEAVAAYTQHIDDKYHYKLSNGLCGDETYVKIRGKTHYVFFISDIKTKIILAYRIFKNRDTLNAVKSIFMAINKYKELPEGFHIVTDGNPIYNAAQLFFHLNGFDFDLHQVIGVTNKDEQSAQWRPYKQIEERLNRTFKQNYYGTNGYDNLKTANIYMVLYVAFFNFLRRHSSLDFKPPVDDGLFDENELMPIKWLKLIDLSKQYLNA